MFTRRNGRNGKVVPLRKHRQLDVCPFTTISGKTPRVRSGDRRGLTMMKIPSCTKEVPEGCGPHQRGRLL